MEDKATPYDELVDIAARTGVAKRAYEDEIQALVYIALERGSGTVHMTPKEILGCTIQIQHSSASVAIRMAEAALDALRAEPVDESQT